jgi:hypothetical protein
MAETDLSGFNGDVALPTGHGGEAHGFTVRRTMSSKATNRYGADRFERWRGGTIGISGDVNVFLRMGAAGTAPGIVSPSADGATLTLTLESGCTLAGVAIFPDLNITHEFTDPAIEGTHGYRFNGVVTETWATGT